MVKNTVVSESRLDAIASGDATYICNNPCKHGHGHERYVKSYQCVQCAKGRNIKSFRKGYKDNPGKYHAKTMARRAAKYNRTPSWANMSTIRRIYELCHMISEDTGIVHHVDHIIPMLGKNISGLHVHQNLQILPATDNWAKGNRYAI